MPDSIRVNTQLDNKEFFAGSRELHSAIRSFQQSVTRIGKQIASSANGYGDAMRNYALATRKAGDEITTLYRKVSDMRRKFNESAQNSGYSEFMKMRDDISALEVKLDEANKKAERLYQTKGANSSAYQKAQQDADDLSYKLIELQKQMNTMERPSDKDILNMRQQEMAIESVEDELRELVRIRDEIKPPYLEGWNRMVTLSSMIGRGFGVIQYAAGTALTAITHPIQAIDRGLGFIVQKAGQVAVSLAKMIGNGALSFLRKLASGAVNAAIQLARLAGNAVISGLRRLAIAARDAAINIAKIGGTSVKTALGGLARLVSAGTKALLGLGKSSRKSGDSFKASLKTIIKYAFGVRSLFFLFRRLRSAVIEGLGEISKRNPQLKTAVDGLKKSFNGLKGSLSSAFAPIVTAVAPALTKLIDMLTNAINSMGAFMAALTGQKTYQKSIGAIGDSAKTSSKNVKELKRQLASFDELNILSANDSNSSSTGKESGFAYETENIASNITDFVKELKELWSAKDFEGIGELIAMKLNEVVKKIQDAIRWEKIGPAITTFVNGITDGLNGLVNKFDWNNLGKTIGDGLNSITNTLLLWFNGFDWANFGKKIGEGLNGLVDDLDFANVGELLAKKMTYVLTIMANAAAEFDWVNFGRKLAIGFNKFLSTLDDVLSNIDWADLTAKFVSGLNRLISDVDWTGIGKFLKNRAGDLITILKTAVTEFKWGDTGTKLATAINEFFEDDSIWEDAGNTIDKTIKGMLDFTKKFQIEFNAEEAGEKVRNALGQIQWSSIAADFWDNVTLAFNNAGSFLNALLGGSSKKKSKVIKPSQINTQIGMLAADVGGLYKESSIWDDLANNLSNGFNNVVKKFSDFISGLDFKGVSAKIFGWLVKVKNGVSWSAIGTLIGKSFNSVLDVISTAVTTFKNNASTTGRDFADAINKIIGKVSWTGENSVQSTIEDGFKSAIKVVDGFFENFKSAEFAEKIRGVLTDKDMWAGIANDAWAAFAKAFQSAADFLTVLFGGDLSAGKSKPVIKPSQKGTQEAMLAADVAAGNSNKTRHANGSELTDAIMSTIASLIRELDKWVKGIDWKNLGDRISEVLSSEGWSKLANAIWDIFKDAISGIYDLIKALAEHFSVTIKDTWEATKEAAKSAEEAGENAANGFSGAVKKLGLEKALELYGTVYARTNPETGKAYNLDLSGLSKDLAEKGLAIINEAEAKDPIFFWENVDGLVDFASMLVENGESFVDVQKRFQLTAEQLDAVDRNTSTLFTRRNGTDDFKTAQLIANNQSAYDAAFDAISKNGYVKSADFAAQYGLDLTDAIRIINAASEAVYANTEANKENTVATNNNSVAKFEVDEHFSLDPLQFELVGDQIHAIIEQSISDEHLDVTALVNLGLPDESILEVEKYFINKWNENHPEAPVTLSVESFDNLSDLIGGAEAYRVLYNSGVDMSNELARGIAAGKVAVKQSGETMVIEFADGTSRMLSEEETKLYNDSFDVAAKIRQGIKDGSLGAEKIGSSVVLTFSDGTKKTLKGEEVSIYNAAKAAAESIPEGYKVGVENGSKKQSFLQSVADMAFAAINQAKTTLDSHSPSRVFEAIGKDTVDGYAQGITSQKESALSTIQSAFQDITDRVSQTVSGVVGAVANFFGGKKTNTGNNADSLASPYESAAERIKDATEAIVTATTTSMAAVKGEFDKLKTDSTTIFEELKTNLTTSIRAFTTEAQSRFTLFGVSVGAMTNTANQQISNMKRIFDDMKMYFVQTFTGLQTESVKLFTDMTINIKTSIDTMSRETTSAISGMRTSLFTEFGNINREVSSAVAELGKALNSFSSNLSTGTQMAVSDMSRNISGAMFDLERDVGWGLQSISYTVSREMSNITWTIVDSLERAVNNANNKDWQYIGVNIVNGINAGLVKAYNSMAKAFVDAVNKLIADAKKALEIKSPSRVFRDEIGVYIGLGIAEGIDDSQNAIFQSTMNATDVIADGVNSASIPPIAVASDIAGGLGEVLGLFSDNVADGFTALVERLEAIANDVTFRTPVMATGTVMPYDTTARAESSMSEVQNILDANNEDLIQTIIYGIGQIVSAIQSQDRRERRSDLSAQQVINEINRRALMYSQSPIKGV